MEKSIPVRYRRNWKKGNVYIWHVIQDSKIMYIFIFTIKFYFI